MVAPSWEVLDGEYRQHVQMRMRGVPPPNGGSYARLAGGGGGRSAGGGEGRLAGGGGVGRLAGGGVGRLAGGGGGGIIRRIPSFPLKDDAGYIGYLTDDEEEDTVVSGGGGGGSTTVARRRRELLGSDADVSFSNCLFMMITVCGLLMLFLFAVSPWGVPPPKLL